MPLGNARPPKVIIDPNLLISMLISKRLGGLYASLVAFRVGILVSDELISEFKDVAKRNKFRKYFSVDFAEHFADVIEGYGTSVNVVRPFQAISRDPKDDYLLAMADAGKADVLITGDEDLLVLKSYNGTRIMNAAAFKRAYLGG
jgi:hypothetical protein